MGALTTIHVLRLLSYACLAAGVSLLGIVWRLWRSR